jgi:hypothetical protein
VKKDYLYGGAMADSADLVVLGAWFGTGHKGKILPCGMHLIVPYYREVYCFKPHVKWATCHHSMAIVRLWIEEKLPNM